MYLLCYTGNMQYKVYISQEVDVYTTLSYATLKVCKIMYTMDVCNI